MDDCTNCLLKLLQLLKVKHTEGGLIDLVHTHPSYPSILAMADTLERYNVNIAVLRIDKTLINTVPTPFVAQLTSTIDSRVSEFTSFCTVKRITKERVLFFDNQNRNKSIDIKEFLNKWTGIALLAEKNKNSIEPNFKSNFIKLNTSRILFSVFLFSCFVLLFRFIIISQLSFNQFLFFILKCIGLITAILLLIYEIKTIKPALQKFCTGGKKLNCDMVVNSKYAKIPGTNLSLGAITLAYFIASLVVLTVNFFQLSILFKVISALTIPLILYSFYIQAFVIKKWCRLCLIILAILITENILMFSINAKINNFNLDNLILFITTFILIVLLFNWVQPIIINSKRINLFKRVLVNIKTNSVVFNTLLKSSKKISTETENMGISIKNKEPKHHLIIVCSPYCNPCSKLHLALDRFVKNGSIDLQILFVAQADSSDFNFKPVSHFMAIYNSLGVDVAMDALTNWYGDKSKDYNRFAKKYPMNGELKAQFENINKMYNWCLNENIKQTPTIFIDSYELPSEYDVDDITLILK